MTELVPLPNFRAVILEAIKYCYLKDLCEIVIRRNANTFLSNIVIG